MTARTASAKTATASSTNRDLTAEIGFLSRALKAPTMRDAVARLAERARAESWSHAEFLVACLQREVSARESHAGEGRIRAARFPSRKSLEEFDFDHARGLKRDLIAHLAPAAPCGTRCAVSRLLGREARLSAAYVVGLVQTAGLGQLVDQMLDRDRIEDRVELPVLGEVDVGALDAQK
jgi:hypothetical protein